MLRRAMRTAMGGAARGANNLRMDALKGASAGSAIGYGGTMAQELNDDQEGVDGMRVLRNTVNGFAAGGLGGAAGGSLARTGFAVRDGVKRVRKRLAPTSEQESARLMKALAEDVRVRRSRQVSTRSPRKDADRTGYAEPQSAVKPEKGRGR